MRLARSSSRWHAALGSALIVAAATVLNALLDTVLPASVLALIYIVAVLIVANRFAYGYAVASAATAVVILNVFFIHPRGDLRIASQEHGVALGALLIVSLFASYLASRQRTSSRAALESANNATRLRQLAGNLGDTNDITDMAARVLAHLQLRFGPAAVALVQADLVENIHTTLRAANPDLALDVIGNGPPAYPALNEKALRHCISSNQSLGWGTGRWNNLRATCIPLTSGSFVQGALAVQCDTPPQQGDLNELQTVSDLLAAAIQRERNASDALEARANVQSQALRNTLLASVSHDFRTPLASIIGSASALVQQHDRLSSADALRLAAQIESEARYLAEMTENTLHWIRLTSGGPPPVLDWQAVGEILSEVIARVRLRDSTIDLQLRVPLDLPLIRGDAVLLAQAVGNLLDNALKYAHSPIVVSATPHDQRLWIDVADRGVSLSPHERARIFETFYRGPHAHAVRGAGLGLSIAQAVACAHDGELAVLPRMDGGNIFRLDLPIPTAPEIEPESMLHSTQQAN